MIEYLTAFNYIKDQLTYIRTKVDIDNQLGLFDINKLSEDIFMHILNDVYDFNLKNANLIQENFPAIDLVDDTKKVVVQVTSTTSSVKLRDTIKKFNDLTDYADYKLKIFYIKNKPNFHKDSLSEFESSGVVVDDILGIDDVLETVQADQDKCFVLYKTILQRMDNISFNFNINSYFDKFESQLETITTNKFKEYEALFKEFIKSDNKVFEIYAAGGNGKSHILKYFANLESEYIPLVFTKQVNIEDDLKKLSVERNYLLIFDDIDRFLDSNVLVSLLSYILSNDNCKLLITYRSASKDIINAVYRKYTTINKVELEITWSDDDISSLIKNLNDSIKEPTIKQLSHTFNNNPYLITQALRGDLHTIKEFSKKTIDDVQSALKEYSVSDALLEELMFELSLVVPISENDIKKYFPENVNHIEKLKDMKVLRKLANKYRFNPDIQGDLFLGYYIDQHNKNFEEKVEAILPIFSQTVFTNLSYALTYSQSGTLTDFIKRVIGKWDRENTYRNDYLFLVNKIVTFAPLESFIYLKNATKYLIPKENEHMSSPLVDLVATKVSPQSGDFNSDINAINFGSIEPIISKLVNLLKNASNIDDLEVKHIISYLVSDEILSLPKPYYDNQTLNSIFRNIVSPLNTRNFNVILDTLAIMQTWINEENLNIKKLNLLKDTVQSLLSATVDNSYSEGFTYHFGQVPLNLKHPEVIKIIDKAEELLSEMLDSDSVEVLYAGIDSISSIGGRDIDRLEPTSQKFYSDLKAKFLTKLLQILNTRKELFLVSKIEDLAVNTLNFYDEKDEAIQLLKATDRSDEFILYQMVSGTDFLIVDFDTFYIEYQEQDNIKDWMFDSVYRTDKYELKENEFTVIKNLSIKYTDVENLIKLLNSLDTSNWNSYRTLLRVLSFWYDKNSQIISEVCTTFLNKIDDEITINVLKELALDKGIVPISVDDITDSTSSEDLKVYLSSIFKSYTHEKLPVLQEIVGVVEKRDVNEIRMFISIISGDLYFVIKSDVALYESFEPIIVKFLDLQLKYNLDIESYLTYHILGTIKPVIGIPDIVKDKLLLIINNQEIYIEKHDLESIYKLLEIEFGSLLDTLFKKLTSKKSDGTYKHYFSHYFDHDKITESLLIKEYVKTYNDFKFLIDKTLYFYNSFTEYLTDKEGNQKAIKINLDYFLKYAVKYEFIEQLFSDLIASNDIESIKILYTIAPVEDSYFNIIINNLNILDGKVDDENLINYLRQIGKIKSYSSAPMENSPQLLSEEQLFQKVHDVIDSLTLKLRIKDELKYIAIQKKEEVERDLEFLLGKK